MSELPTKPTAWMSGCSRMASTASLSPCTTWNTPGGQAGLEEQLGQPHRHRRVALGLGLRMNALPHASAGPAFHSGIIAGKLNGVMPATTPSGWRSE